MLNKLKAGLRKVLCVLAIPVLEAALLRYWLHSHLKISIGWPWGIVDADIAFPGFIALTILLLAVDAKEELPIAFSKRNAGRHLILLGITGVTAIGFSSSPLLIYLIAATLFSSLFIFSSFGFLRKKQHWIYVLACATVGFSHLVPKHLPESLWKQGAPYLKETACRTIQALDPVAVCRMVERNETMIKIAHPQYNVYIGKGCAGVEAILLFFALFVFLAAHQKPKPHWQMLLPLSILTFLVAVLANHLRIAFIYWSYTRAYMNLPYSQYQVFNKLMHWNAGWIIYVFMIAAYFGFYTLLKKLTKPVLSAELAASMQDAVRKIKMEKADESL